MSQPETDGPPCRTEGCDARVISMTAEREYARTAPDWHHWPTPPPQTMTVEVPVRDHFTERCSAGHIESYWMRPTEPSDVPRDPRINYAHRPWPSLREMQASAIKWALAYLARKSERR